MEQFLECFLDNFEERPRNSLHDRRNRRSMVEYISTLIEGCAGEDKNNTKTTCEEAVSTLIEYHNKHKLANGGVCMMGKYHNILYVAMKLCYLWQVANYALVCQLLQEIYSCEGTFERLLIGAIFGTTAPHYIAGWKSDFDHQEDNVRGMVYFLDKANGGKLVLGQHRFIDLPIESCGKAPPVKICLQLGTADKLHILLRFGGLVSAEDFEHLCKRLMEFNHCYPYNLVACLQMMLRVVPTTTTKYPDLMEDGLIPLSRCGVVPTELKHLCRCTIRDLLWQNHALPHGIRRLPLPDRMWRYLDIMHD